MFRSKIVFGVACGIVALMAFAPLARAQENPFTGVPVQVLALAYGKAEHGEPAEFWVQGSGFLPTELSEYAYNNNAGYATWYAVQQASYQVIPGQDCVIYTDSISYPSSIAKTKVILTAPNGYRLFIDGVERSTLEVNGESHSYIVRLVAPNPDPVVVRAGESSSLQGEGINWRVGLGALRNGNSAGFLELLNAGNGSSWAAVYTPAALHYRKYWSEVLIHRVGNQIRQIIANEAAVDVVTLNSTSYELRFYNPTQVVGSSGLRTFTGEPFVTSKIEQGSTATTLKLM